MTRGERILHTIALAAWFGGRALLAAGAVTAASMQAGLLAATAVTALVILVRPLRRGWIHALPLALLAPIAPVAAALLAGRFVLGELALQAAGHEAAAGTPVGRPRRRQGVMAVLEPRRSLLRRLDIDCCPSVAEASDSFARVRASSSNGAEFERAALSLLGTMWADAHPVELARRVPELVVSVLATLFESDEPGAEGSAMGTALAKGLVIEMVGPLIVSVSVLVPAALVGALLFPADQLTIGHVTISGSIAQAAGILVLGVGLCARSPSLVFVGAVVAWLLTRSHFWDAVLIAGAAGGVGILGRRAVKQFAVGGRTGPPRPERVSGPRRLRLQWRAAMSAADGGRLPIAIDLLDDLAASAACPAELRARAHSRRARLLFETGRLEDASAALERVPADASDDPEHLLALGTVATGTGDLQGAEEHLKAALAQLPRGSTLAHRATLTLAQVLSRLDRPDEAIELTTSSRTGAWSYGGLARVVESETAIAGALRRRGDLDRAASRLDEALDLGMIESAHVGELSRELRLEFARVEAGARLMAGETALERERHADAVAHLKGVRGRVQDGRDAHVLACSQALQGVAMIFAGDTPEGLRMAQRGIELLEARRRQLRHADRRTGLILAERDLYEWCFKAFAHASGKDVDGAGEAAAWLIESLRKSAISSMLRADALEFPAAASALADQLSELEQGVNEVAADGTVRSVGHDDAAVDGEIARLRGELGDALSQQFALSYVPTPTSIDELRSVAQQHGDVLSFYLPGGALPGWRAWISPTGEFTVDRLEVKDQSARDVLDDLRSGGGMRMYSAVYEPLRDSSAEVWEALGRALLPAGLRAALADYADGAPARPLIVVPDGLLGLLPWAALQVQGVALGQRCAIQLLPSLGIVEAAGSEPAAQTPATALAYLDESLPGHLDEYAALEQHLVVTRAGSRREFVDALGLGQVGGAYLAAHGVGLGLSQGISFEDGFLSAGSALLSRWPDWTIFASCLVGRIEMTAGQEPLGLPISCVLGGSRSVLAAMVEVPSDEMATFVAPMLAELAQGSDPAHALVCAQRRYLDEHPYASVAECLAFVCVSGAPQRTRPSSSRDLAARSCDEIADDALRMAADDPARARGWFRGMLEVHPDPALLLHYAGFLAPSDDTRPEAREILERAVEDAPEDGVAWAWHAWFFDQHTNDTERTRASFERLLELDPEHHWGIARFARFLLRRTDDHGAAAAFHKRALLNAPRSATIAAGYGDALERLGDLAGAARMYERALAIDPDQRYAGGQLARVIARLGGEPERVARLFERAIAYQPRQTSYFLNAWALAAARDMHDRTLARRLLERTIRAEPDDAVATVNLAWLLFGAGQTTAASMLARRALDLAEDDEDEVRLEAWFYLAALAEPAIAAEARGRVVELIDAGVRSDGWDLTEIVARSRELRPPEDVAWVEEIAPIVTNPALGLRGQVLPGYRLCTVEQPDDLLRSNPRDTP